MQEVKKQVLEIVQKMPPDASIDDIFEELHFKLQVDKGLQELDEGKGLSQEEVEKRML